MSKSLFAVLLLTAAMVLSGCGSDGPSLGEVRGVVTLDGENLTKGRIIFKPLDGGRSSEGEIGKDGTYRLIYSLNETGAKVGQHSVHVTTQNEFGGGETIPDKYNAKSELEAEVQRGRNEFNFDLVTK